MNKERVLIVEDNLLTQRLTRVLLEKEGYEVCVAEDGMEALNLLETFQPKIILMDIELPSIDGAELTAMIRSEPRNSDIFIIALTAHRTDEWRQRALDAGCDTYLAKPVSMATLREAISQGRRGMIGRPIESAAVDRDALMIRLGGDRDLLRELQQIFVAECPRLSSELHRYLEARDSASLADAAHAMKGMLSTFSASGGESAAQALEMAGSAGDLTVAAGALEQVDRQVVLVLKSLAEMVEAA